MARIVRIHQTGGPDVLRLDEIDPAPPGPGEIALQVKALGLNRAESMFRSGHYVEQPVFPARLGYEAAGVVSALGPGVTGFAIGDAVSIVPPLSISRWGTYGEVATVPADVAVKHPASLGWTEAAAVWMQYVTAWGALIDLAQIKRGDAVVITAASSSVGLAAIQVARMAGAVAIATTRTDAKAQALREFGADHVIVTQREDLAARVREITGGAGARVAFDPVAGPALPQLADALAFGGIVIEYGALAAEQAPFPLFAVLGKMLSVHGYQYKRVVGDPAKLDAAKRFVLDGLASGALKPAIDRVFPLDRIADAHRYLESNEQFGKIVVTV
ncbi:zinc-dependent alcohol dehydrogenase family protein [Burkholderia thailandensis]|uniref:Quinone oxidoreductase n=1 Tax=Burkholderia thailandensis (strain ATCC 700388 / DSM 13276 / CCUG 48851 / CIP 106301 / E264) TaxID=271848 RepID=Q2T1K4_BURTA|nr:zinc-dependent alcohol dehydrogenase family protein [Burkholderia thailandensis]ABC36620.1 quinone oxidoreductase [Burkholderia thailandensis E264]AHI73758.1 zinc-binding dehydrogenase family protein [Burkholderia thailandensis 2002721723]AHI79681.1 zinc-binding dehydrogenase family protein [Burkholderia thailandensis E444]AIC87783.1 zinc-binding dehydrogenase family protein [Burkholderia thailandensis USAMRU Malaysia \